MIPFRVGIGFDSHRLEEGRKLVLGGVHVPFEKGLQGHSDADVLLHAITDALCGAAGLPDIGRLFPDDAAQWKDADSADLLERVAEKVRDAGWQIGNVDAVLVAQRPKIAPFVPEMKEIIAKRLHLSVDCVNLRGKTAEGMDDVGAGLGMQAHAVALLVRASDRFS
jgi:2-C-methyl-D-erythritol 2,4-cyclodiphosphate synthase